MEQTLINILKSIVKYPDDVLITKEEAEMGVVTFHISTNEEDKGLIIGKNGRTIKALKDLIAVKALKENKKVYLKVD